MLNNILFEEPGYAPLHHTLGCIFFDHADDAKKAEQHLRLAIRFDPELAGPYSDLGQLLSDNERFELSRASSHRVGLGFRAAVVIAGRLELVGRLGYTNATQIAHGTPTYADVSAGVRF